MKCIWGVSDLFGKVPDFFFVFGVANHQVIIFCCNNQVVYSVNNSCFVFWDIDDAVVGMTKNDMRVMVACIVVFVLFA